MSSSLHQSSTGAAARTGDSQFFSSSSSSSAASQATGVGLDDFDNDNDNNNEEDINSDAYRERQLASSDLSEASQSNPTCKTILSGGAHNRQNVGLLQFYRSPLVARIQTLFDICEAPVPLHYFHLSEYLTLCYSILCLEVKRALEHPAVDPYIYELAECIFYRMYGTLIHQYKIISFINEDGEDRGCSQSLNCFLCMMLALLLMQMKNPKAAGRSSDVCSDAYPVLMENCMCLYGDGWDKDGQPWPIAEWSQMQVYNAWQSMSKSWMWMRGVFSDCPETAPFYSPREGLTQLRAYRWQLLLRTAFIVNYCGAPGEGDRIIDMLSTPINNEFTGYYTQREPLSVEVRFMQELLDYFVTTETTLLAYVDFIQPRMIDQPGVQQAKQALLRDMDLAKDVGDWTGFVRRFESFMIKDGMSMTNITYYEIVTKYIRTRMIPVGWRTKGYFENRQVPMTDNDEMEATLYPGQLRDFVNNKMDKLDFGWYLESDNIFGSRDAAFLHLMDNMISVNQTNFHWIDEVVVAERDALDVMMLAPCTGTGSDRHGNHVRAEWTNAQFPVEQVMHESMLTRRNRYTGERMGSGVEDPYEIDVGAASASAASEGVDAQFRNMTLDDYYAINENANSNSNERSKFFSKRWIYPMSERDMTFMPFILQWSGSYMVYCNNRIYTMPGGITEACAFWMLLILLAGKGTYQRGDKTKLDIAFLYRILSSVTSIPAATAAAATTAASNGKNKSKTGGVGKINIPLKLSSTAASAAFSNAAAAASASTSNPDKVVFLEARPHK